MPDNKPQSYRGQIQKKPSMFETGGRVMPQDKEVEEAVLGALMLEKDAYTTCATS